MTLGATDPNFIYEIKKGIQVDKPLIHFTASDPRMDLKTISSHEYLPEQYRYPNIARDPNNYDPRTFDPKVTNAFRLYIPDPNGIGDRGYVRGTNHHPYAKQIADVIEACFKQTGKTCYIPKLDANANNFIFEFIKLELPNNYKLLRHINTYEIRHRLRSC